MRLRAPGAASVVAGTAARLLAGAFVDLLGLAGFVAVVLGVHALWGRGWALLAAGALMLAGYALAEIILPLRLSGRSTTRTGA